MRFKLTPNAKIYDDVKYQTRVEFGDVCNHRDWFPGPHAVHVILSISGYRYFEESDMIDWFMEKRIGIVTYEDDLVITGTMRYEATEDYINLHFSDDLANEALEAQMLWNLIPY